MCVCVCVCVCVFTIYFLQKPVLQASARITKMDDSSDSEAGYSPLDFVSPPRANRAVRDAAPAPVMETPRHQIIRPYRPQYERPVQVPPSIAPPSAMWTQQTGGGDSVPYTITPVQAAARSISRPQQGSSVRHPELRSQRVRGSVRTGGSTRPRPTPAASEASSQPAANPSAFFANAVLKKQAKGAKNRPASQKKPTPAPPQPAVPGRQPTATRASARRPPAPPSSSVFSPEARRVCDTPVMGRGAGVAPSYVSSPTVASLASVDLQGRYARDASFSLPAAEPADAVATPASGISIHFDVSDDEEDEANVKMPAALQRPATAPATAMQQQNSPSITEILARGITESPEAQRSTAAPSISLPSTGGGTSLRPSTFMRRRYSGGVPRPAKRVCRRAIDMSDDDDDDDDDDESNGDEGNVAGSNGGDVPSTPAPAASVVATAATSFHAAATTATECGTSTFEGDDYAVSTPSSMLTETTNSAALSPPGSSLTRPTLPTTSEAAAAAAAAEATSRAGAATVATSRMAVGGTKKSVAWDSDVDAASWLATTHKGAGGGGGGCTTTGAAASTYLPSPSLLEGEGVGGCMSAMSGHTDLSALQYTPVSCASQDLLGCGVTSYGGAASTVPPELSISARATMQKGSTVRGALSSYLPSPSLLGVAGDEQATTAPFTPGSVAPPSAMPWSETAASVRPAKRAKGKKTASSRAAATASDLASQFGGLSQYNVAVAPKGRSGGMLPPAFCVDPQTPSLLRERRGGSVATSVGRSSMKSGATAASAAADSTCCFTPMRKGAPMRGPTGAFKSLNVKMSQSEEDEWKEESGAWVASFNAYIQECQNIEL